MPRPKNNRIVYEPPSYTEFQPAEVSIKLFEEIQLNLDEFETIRLAEKLEYHMNRQLMRWKYSV